MSHTYTSYVNVHIPATGTNRAIATTKKAATCVTATFSQTD